MELRGHPLGVGPVPPHGSTTRRSRPGVGCVRDEGAQGPQARARPRRTMHSGAGVRPDDGIGGADGPLRPAPRQRVSQDGPAQRAVSQARDGGSSPSVTTGRRRRSSPARRAPIRSGPCPVLPAQLSDPDGWEAVLACRSGAHGTPGSDARTGPACPRGPPPRRPSPRAVAKSPWPSTATPGDEDQRTAANNPFWSIDCGAPV